MIPDKDVPPPRKLRGVATIRSENSSADSRSLISVHGKTWACSNGPAHWT